MTCAKCGKKLPRANLTDLDETTAAIFRARGLSVNAGDLWCPSDLYEIAAKAWSSQKLAATEADPDAGVERVEGPKPLRPRGRPPGKRPPKAITEVEPLLAAASTPEESAPATPPPE